MLRLPGAEFLNSTIRKPNSCKAFNFMLYSSHLNTYILQAI